MSSATRRHEPCGDERTPLHGCRGSRVKLGAVWPGETAWLDGKQPRQRRGRPALPDDRALGKQGRTVYVRNQWLNASQANTTSSNLADMGWAAMRICASQRRELLGRLMSLTGRPR